MSTMENATQLIQLVESAGSARGGDFDLTEIVATMHTLVAAGALT